MTELARNIKDYSRCSHQEGGTHGFRYGADAIVVMMIAIEVRRFQHPAETRHDAQEVDLYAGVLDVDFKLASDESHCHVLDMEGEGGREGEG